MCLIHCFDNGPCVSFSSVFAIKWPVIIAHLISISIQQSLVNIKNWRDVQHPKIPS